MPNVISIPNEYGKAMNTTQTTTQALNAPRLIADHSERCPCRFCTEESLTQPTPEMSLLTPEELARLKGMQTTLIEWMDFTNALRLRAVQAGQPALAQHLEWMDGHLLDAACHLGDGHFGDALLGPNTVQSVAP